MKKAAAIILLAVLGVLAVSCNMPEENAKPAASEGYADPAQGAAASEDLIGCYSPIFFDSKEDFIETLRQMNDPSYDKQTLTVVSERMGEQSYDAAEDHFGLKQIGEIYLPNANDGDDLLFLRVTADYVAFCFGTETETKNFVWLRSMSPDTAYNDLEGRGAYVRMIEDQGVTYAVLDSLDPNSGENGGCSIIWAADGKVFQANYAKAEPDGQMLAFCQYSTEPVR